MRIAYFAHFVGGSDAASAMDADLLAALRAQGHDVTVLSPYAKPETGRGAGDISAARLARLVPALPGSTRAQRAGAGRRPTGTDVPGARGAPRAVRLLKLDVDVAAPLLPLPPPPRAPRGRGA